MINSACEYSRPFAAILTFFRLWFPWLASLALVWAYLVWGGPVLVGIVFGVGIVWGFVTSMIGLAISTYRWILAPMLWGVQCPACTEWSLVRVACVSFGLRFYKCDRCGQRCKRWSTETTWWDASGKEDDDMYQVIPVHSLERRRKLRMKVLRSFGATTCVVAMAFIGWLFGGVRGLTLAVFLGVTFAFQIQRSASLDLVVPRHPALWDPEVDGELTSTSGVYGKSD